MAVTFDPSNKGPSLTLSNGNLTVSHTVNDWEQALATEGKSSGKWYFEIYVDAGGTNYYSVVGAQDGTVDLELHTGQGAGGYGYMDNARFYNANSYNSVNAGWSVSGYVVMVALDMDNGKVWFGVNGNWSYRSGESPDPASGTDPAFSGLSGAFYPSVSLYYSGASLSARFVSGDFSYTPPSGFSAYDSSSSGATEPDISSDGLGLGETIGRNIEKTRGITAGLGFNESVDGNQEGVTEEGLSDGLAIGETIGRNVERVRGITAGIGFNGLTNTSQEADEPMNAGLGLGETIGVSIELARVFSAGLSFGESAGAFNYSAWLRANKHLATYRYYSKITGGADGLSDYPIPGLKSFQFRMRSGDPSYLSLVFVYTTALLSAISARENGEIVLDMVAVVNGEESLREELIRAPFYSVRYDRGAKSQSLTLIGYQTREYGGARVELENVTTETMLADGRMQFRCARPDFYLRPGDTAIYGAHEITVGQIISSVAANSQMMDVSE